MRRWGISIATGLTTAWLMAGCSLDPLPFPADCAEVDCDDGNPCTTDVCNIDGTCRSTPVIAGQVCDDGDACNGIGTCDADGLCVASAPVDTGDGDACTEDICDPLTGTVTHEPIPGCMVTDPGWAPLPATGAPGPRWLHVGLWTGTEMIIWGGKPGPGAVAGDGALYDPATDTWRPMSTTNAPSPRHSASAVWTGTEMIVWGGFGQTDYVTDGARYNPTTDTWTPISNAGAPTGRTFQSTAWTGTEMIVWGGINGVNAVGTGARYNPTPDAWQALPPTGAPSVRLKHAATWTGSEMVVWGGTDTFDWLATGARYDPGGDTWTGATNPSGAPFIRESHTSTWTGDRVAIWGGWDGGNYLQSGGLYDPTSDSWTAMSDVGAPSTRARHTASWTGDALFIWGGCAGTTCEEEFRATGGIWRPLGGPEGAWSPVVANDNLSERSEHIAVWTGAEIIVWGGRNGDGVLGDGARASVDAL
jgi:hypothetical protein